MTKRADPVASARSLLFAGAAIVAAGLTIAGTASPNVGGFVTLVGWLTFVWAIHKFGRARAT